MSTDKTTSHVPSIVAIIAAVIAAATSVFVAYESKEAKRDYVERQGKLQKNLDALNDVLERNREFTGFRRKRVGKHLDQVIDAYIDIYSIAQLIPLRKWVQSNNDLETEARFRSSLSRLRAHFGALESLQVVSKEICTDFKEKDSSILEAWNAALSEAAYRTPEFRKEFPNASEFSSEKYLKKWMDFMTHVENIGIIIKGLSNNISLPK